MSVRLNKVCRELNIGFQTLSDFLLSKGFVIELSPNFKLTDEQAVLAYRHIYLALSPFYQNPTICLQILLKFPHLMILIGHNLSHLCPKL